MEMTRLIWDKIIEVSRMDSAVMGTILFMVQIIQAVLSKFLVTDISTSMLVMCTAVLEKTGFMEAATMMFSN